MTFDQLKYFIAVVEENTFFDAAETLHISQSSLSKQIMKLEKELDITLLDRSRRSCSLTEAGQFFYQEALQLTKQYRQTLFGLKCFRENRDSELRIGTLPILSHYRLIPLIKKYSEIHRQIHLEIDEVEEVELINGFNAGKYDLIIAREPLLRQCSCETCILVHDELTAVLPSSHRYAHSSSVSLPELACEDFLLMNRYTSVFHLCMEEFKKYGISANIIRNARAESIIGAVAANEGISLLPMSNFEVFRHQNVAALPLAPPVQLPVAAAMKKNGSSARAAKEFISYLCKNIE
ncbi:LysR family transcriptional regulator [Faecalicatena orotica]|uniref:DNA-binding transcriptional LysR family regulator n=1 Tax=Faecalicatena orotica TaxID=1544 RepID=A0A2Y9C9J5_9FIRM|nr:LysR family transcriptional regulator [Faecalicatena orotica]PWJ32209.1 DNA-binding transcriptional LysR family regulator [Faecalicatena orotica]SSA54042.1 DNA-binding transcriptional regulator, LysR family [Faecalicatena orotica]